MLRELKSKLKEISALVPASYSASTNGSTIDTQGLSALEFVFHVGALTAPDGSNYFDLKIEDSDDGSSWSAYATVKSCQAAGDANQVYAANYGGVKRYARAVVTETGTAVAGLSCQGIGLLQHAP
jgi:hypothetical protein